MKISWRIVWYSVVIWIVTWILGNIVVLPWFYLVTPFAIFLMTFIFFKHDVLIILERRKSKDNILLLGLAVSIAWFFLLLGFTSLEVAGPYYSNILFYFSDFRNWLMYPLVLLVPFVYCLVIDNRMHSRRRKRQIGKGTVVGF